MDSFAKRLLKRCWNLQIQIVRHRNKINITKPRPLHFERDVVERLCVPYFFAEKRKPTHLPEYGLCDIQLENRQEKDLNWVSILTNETIFFHCCTGDQGSWLIQFLQSYSEIISENPIEDILGKEVLNKFNHSKLIAIFHKNYLDDEEKFESEVLLKNNGLKLLSFGNKVMKKGLTGTIYEPILRFYQSQTAIVLGEEPDIYNLLNVIKKTPKLLLLAAVVNNRRLLNIAEIENFGKERNLESARQSFLGVLNSLSLNLIQELNYFPNSVVHCLEQHKLKLKNIQ